MGWINEMFKKGDKVNFTKEGIVMDRSLTKKYGISQKAVGIVMESDEFYVTVKFDRMKFGAQFYNKQFELINKHNHPFTSIFK